MSGMKNDSQAGRRRTAKAWLTFAGCLVLSCLIVPQCIEPDLLPPALVSIYLLWVASPFAATAAGYGTAILCGERVGKVIFIALTVALFFDLCLLPVAINIVN